MKICSFGVPTNSTTAENMQADVCIQWVTEKLDAKLLFLQSPEQMNIRFRMTLLALTVDRDYEKLLNLNRKTDDSFLRNSMDSSVHTYISLSYIS